MGEQQFRQDRPDTIGEAWRGMSKPRQRKPRDLPTLPDWPPLTDEPAQAAWPSLNPSIPDESHPDDALQPTVRDDTLWPSQTPPAVAPLPSKRDGIRRRFRGASKRARIGIAAGAAILLVALIVACSSLALHTTSGLVPGAAHAATRSSLPSVTPHPTRQPTTTSLPSPTTAPSPPLAIAFTCASGQIHGTGQVCVHTLPQAALSLSVRYCDGSTAKGLHGSATADASGNYTWSWPVRTACAGPATATVTANWNGQSRSQTDTFTITK